jgi:iron complex transport system ATP-binding protein
VTTSAPPGTALTATGVDVVRGGTPILSEVDVAVRSGELLVLAGPNGAGKSTLLSVLAGDTAPDRGSVRLREQPLAAVGAGDLARERAVMLQEQRVAFAFLVRELVAMGRAPWQGRPESDDDEAVVAAALATADVAHLAGRRFPTLSGGERARTAFARLLAQDCPVLLLDEPTAALDIHHQETLLGALRELTATGAAVVAVLHDLTLAAAYADRVALLAGGRMRACGSPAEVLTPETLTEVYRHPVDVLPHPVTGDLLVLPRRTVPFPPAAAAAPVLEARP